MDIVISLFLIIIIGVEIAAIVGLIYLLIKIKEANEMLPPIFKQALEEMVFMREQLKDINKKFEKVKPKPMDSLEIGKIFGQLIFKMILMRKFSIVQVIKILIKHRIRLSATFAKYN